MSVKEKIDVEKISVEHAGFKGANFSYDDFVDKGRQYFNRVFTDVNDESQKSLLKSILNDGWRRRKANKDIASDFGIKYKTFNGRILEYGIESNSKSREGIIPYRKLVALSRARKTKI